MMDKVPVVASGKKGNGDRIRLTEERAARRGCYGRKRHRPVKVAMLESVGIKIKAES